MSESTLMTAAETPTDGESTSDLAAETSTGEASAVTQQAESIEPKEESNPQGAPEKYEFVPPEGQQYDAGVIDKFSEVAKRNNMTQEAAQDLLNSMGPVIAERQQQQIDAARQKWADDTRSGTELGGEKLNENLATAKKALDSFGTPELTALLDESGMGNHPEVIRVFHRIGKAISEDKFVGGRGKAGVPSDPAKRMFPNMN